LGGSSKSQLVYATSRGRAAPPDAIEGLLNGFEARSRQRLASAEQREHWTQPGTLTDSHSYPKEVQHRRTTKNRITRLRIESRAVNSGRSVTLTVAKISRRASTAILRGSRLRPDLGFGRQRVQRERRTFNGQRRQRE
jgi:hypothetical protein